MQQSERYIKIPRRTGGHGNGLPDRGVIFLRGRVVPVLTRL
jgi:hypothetical protein